MVTIPNCHTCTHPRRRMIERLLIDGESPPRIAKRMARLDGPSEASIRRHYQRLHMPVDARSVVERQEEQAQRHAAHVEAVTGFYVRQYADAQQRLNDAHVRVVSGRRRFSMADSVKAAALMMKIEAQAAEQERAERAEREGTGSLLRALRGVLEITRAVAGDDAWVEIVSRADNTHPNFQQWSHHPDLGGLMEEHRQVDENRTYAYRNEMRKRWAAIPRTDHFTDRTRGPAMVDEEAS